MNKYSVLMSVYKNDDAAHLRRALTSIYEEQTRKPDEIVVVFDGPLTEDLYRVLEDFAKEKSSFVHYIPLDVNQGLGEALRIGAQKCTGDYIFRMDSDDISHPLRFEKQVAYVEANPEIDVLGTDIAEFYEDPNKENMRVRVCPAAPKDIVKMGKTRSPMNHVTACIKREALEKSGGYKPLLMMEDYYLWVRMIAAGCVLANINESLVYARIGNGFNDRRGSKILIQGRKVVQQYMLEHGMINVFKAGLNMLYIYGFTYCPSWVRKLAYDKILRK